MVACTCCQMKDLKEAIADTQSAINLLRDTDAYGTEGYRLLVRQNIEYQTQMMRLQRQAYIESQIGQ